MRTRFLPMLVLVVAAVGVGGCDPVAEPWDDTGYFRQERDRAAARANELRQRAHQQSDRTYGEAPPPAGARSVEA